MLRNNLIKATAFICLLFSAVTITAQSAKHWNIDKTHASVNFGIDHFFSEVTGKFKEFDGNINFDPANLGASNATFTIKVASVNTDEKDRDDHLQSADFFDASKFPTMKFVSTKFEKKSDAQYLVHGKLTIKDITKDVVLPMKITGRTDNPWKPGYEILGVQITTNIDRTQYGVGTGSWAATAVVGDEVRIKVNMELDAAK